MGLLERALNIGEAKQFKRYEQRVAAINAFEPELELDDDDELRARLDELRARARGGESLDDLLPGVLRDRPRGRQAPHGDAPLRRPADRRHGAARRLDRRDATGEGKTLTATLAVVLNTLAGKRRARRHRQRLPRAPRRRVDVADLRRARRHRRRAPVRAAGRGEDPRLRLRRHLRHQLRVRLRLPARQHGRAASRTRSRTAAASTRTASRSPRTASRSSTRSTTS